MKKVKFEFELPVWVLAILYILGGGVLYILGCGVFATILGTIVGLILS